MADEIGIMELESDQLLDRLSENPKAVLTELAGGIRADLKAEMEREAAENQVASTFERFKEQYPDFEQRWKSGEIKRYMDERPGHNVLSAYLTMRNEKPKPQSGDNAPLNDSRKHGGRHAVLAQRLHDRRASGSGDSSQPESPELIPTI